jgi:hypothetical protein
MIRITEISGTCLAEYTDITHLNTEIKTEFLVFELSLN